MPTITYYANNCSLGDTSERDCDKFRAWAERELKREYPNYSINVTQEPALVTAKTDDVDNEDFIIEYCSRLWDMYDH